MKWGPSFLAFAFQPKKNLSGSDHRFKASGASFKEVLKTNGVLDEWSAGLSCLLVQFLSEGFERGFNYPSVACLACDQASLIGHFGAVGDPGVDDHRRFWLL